jgi:hypothetical protein
MIILRPISPVGGGGRGREQLKNIWRTIGKQLLRLLRAQKLFLHTNGALVYSERKR